MKKYLLTIVVASIFSSSFSQTIYEVRRAMDFFESNKMQSGDWKNPLSESEIEGTPYLNDEFIAGSIYTVMKHQYVDIPLRYNIYNDNIEFKSGDKIQALAAPEIVERIKFGEYQMVYIPYSNLKKIRKGFFIVLEEGKASLYTKLETEFKKQQQIGMERPTIDFLTKKKIYGEILTILWIWKKDIEQNLVFILWQQKININYII